MTKVCAMSDLHGDFPHVDPCDLVIICGDIVPLNQQISTKGTYRFYKNQFNEWASNLPCEKVLFIAGNHELHLPNHYNDYKQLFPNESKVTYLLDELYEFNGLRIYGTPWCHQFGNWAFMLPDDQLREKFSNIPNDLDILFTHDQPYGYGDIILDPDKYTEQSIGCVPLTEAVLEKQPKNLFVGHLHTTSHNRIKIGNTNRYNVSVKDEKYQMVFDPLVIELQDKN